MPDIVSIGEVLFDVFGDLSLLAGAPLNVTAHLRRLGHDVAFVSGIGHDPLGEDVLRGLKDLGISTHYVSHEPYPTGTVEVTLRDGEPHYAIERDVAYAHIRLSPEALAHLKRSSPAWLYYGTLAQCSATTRATTESLFTTLGDAKRFYDLNLRTGFDDPALVYALLERADVVKLNSVELHRVAAMCGFTETCEEALCRATAAHFSLNAVCVTRGPDGAALLLGSQFYQAPAPPITVVDTVGAGDAFAAALLHGLSSGWPGEKILQFGNRLGSYVASQRGAIPPADASGYQEILSF